jgi:hypothetical protein
MIGRVNLLRERFIQIRMQLSCVSVAFTRSEEGNGCLRAFSAK